MKDAPYGEMKIAFIYDAVYPWEKGGAQKRVWELARRLAINHEVHLYGMHYWNGPKVLEREGVTLHGVCPPYDLYDEARRSIRPAILFATQLAPPLLEAEFDVIDCQQFPYFPSFTSKLHQLLRKSALVITWYEVWDDYWYDYLGTKGAFGKAVEHMSASVADYAVPISEFVAADLRAIGRRDNIRIVENGVDYDGLQAVQTDAEEWDVIYVGRLAEHKRVEVLLDAVAQVSQRLSDSIRTCIIGDGPERTRLKAYAREIGVADQVTFRGFVESDEEVISALKSATIFVLPSIREGFPNTILEANACGTPSIVVNHPKNGSTAVVRDGETGFITAPAAEAIANRIVDVLSNDATRRHLSTNARQFARAHDWTAIVDELEQVYFDAVT